MLLNNFFDLKWKKILDKEGKGIGKITDIVSVNYNESKTEIFGIVNIPRVLQRSIRFPIPLSTDKPISTKKADLVFINI